MRSLSAAAILVCIAFGSVCMGQMNDRDNRPDHLDEEAHNLQALFRQYANDRNHLDNAGRADRLGEILLMRPLPLTVLGGRNRDAFFLQDFVLQEFGELVEQGAVDEELLTQIIDAHLESAVVYLAVADLVIREDRLTRELIQVLVDIRLQVGELNAPPDLLRTEAETRDRAMRALIERGNERVSLGSSVGVGIIRSTTVATHAEMTDRVIDWIKSNLDELSRPDTFDFNVNVSLYKVLADANEFQLAGVLLPDIEFTVSQLFLKNAKIYDGRIKVDEDALFEDVNNLKKVLLEVDRQREIRFIDGMVEEVRAEIEARLKPPKDE